MNIEVDILDTRDGLDVNPDIPFEIKQQLRDNFDQINVKAKRPESPEIKSTLHLRLKDHKIFQCNPRRLSFTEKTN